MDLKWIRSEVSKKPEDIDWLTIIDSCKELYKKENDKKSVLGFSLGFLNFVKSSSYTLIDEIKTMYPNAKIIRIQSQSQLIKMIKESKISRDTISKDMIVIVSDKTTLETAINRYQIPYCTFRCSTTSKKISTNPVRYESGFRWKKENEPSLKWIKGQGLGMKRDNILDEILNY